MDQARVTVRPIDRREVASVGRKARLELVFACRGGRTVLSHAYAEPPFRVGRSFSDAAGVHMILAWSAPGIFGGDDFEQHISLERDASVRLTSQSALQVHPAASPLESERSGAGLRGPRKRSEPERGEGPPRLREARLRSTYQVDRGAVLSCHWDPTIPFAGARLDQHIAIGLAPDAMLYWSDAFMAGREARGERWAFERLAHELRVTRASHLEYLERYQLAPDDNTARPWVAGDACYFGTIVRSGAPASTSSADELHRALAGSGARAAVDALDSRLTLVRLMSCDGARFHDARALARDALAVGQNR